MNLQQKVAILQSLRHIEEKERRERRGQQKAKAVMSRILRKF